MSNPLMNELVGKTRHDDLLREAKRAREEAIVARSAEQPAAPARKRRVALERALALLASIVTPW